MWKLLTSMCIVALAACANGSSAVPVQTSAALQAARGSYHPSGSRQSANAGHAWLYVSGFANNVVDIYDLETLGTPRIGRISAGLSSPSGLFVDSQGKLYVANSTGSVSVYRPGARSPSLTLSQGLTEPVGVTADAGGNVFVANRGSSPSITVYPPGQSVPSRTITGSLIQVPSQLLFDSDGDMYYSDNNTGVSELKSGSSTLVSLNLQGLSRTDGVALDPTNGNLFVGDFGDGTDAVLVYTPGNQNPSRTLRNSLGADSNAVGSIQGAEYVFEPDSYKNVVHFYKDSQSKVSQTLHVGAQYPEGVAVKPEGVP